MEYCTVQQSNPKREQGNDDEEDWEGWQAKGEFGPNSLPPESIGQELPAMILDIMQYHTCA